MGINGIVAMVGDVIGDAEGNLPWKIPMEMSFFRGITMGHPCIMGRKTYFSIPEKYRPLAGRTNIVVSKNAKREDFPEDVLLARSPEDACLMVRGGQDAFLIGGATLYEEFLRKDLVDRFYISKIYGIDVKNPGARLAQELFALNDWSYEEIEKFDQFTVCKMQRIR